MAKTLSAKLSRLVERLRCVESSDGCLDTGVATNWYRNPDGPEAAAIIIAQAEALEIARGALSKIEDRMGGAVCASEALSRISALVGEGK